jgi:hypothetical protein
MGTRTHEDIQEGAHAKRAALSIHVIRIGGNFTCIKYNRVGGHLE